MKKLLAMALFLALWTAAAYGQVCVNTSGPLFIGQSLTDPGATCTLADGLTFSNFAEYAASGFPTNNGINTANPAGLTVQVDGANPNQLDFSTLGLAGEDVQITFQVTAGIVISASIGTGPGDTVSEFLCSGAFSQPSEVCNGTTLNTLLLDSSNGVAINGSTGSSPVTASATDFILKDDSGGSGFSEGFASAAPEPFSLGIVGGGLLLLGLSRRFRR